MIIKNYKQLLSSSRGKNKKAKQAALRLIDKGIRSILPETVLRQSLRLEGSSLFIAGKKFDLGKYKRIFVVGGGKASGLMAEQVEKLLGKRISAGIINDHIGKSRTKIIKVIKAGHPIPNDNGRKGADKMLALLDEAGKDDLVLCLISGGGSALITAPVDHVSLKDLKDLNSRLLSSGADIKKMNCIRKHVSKIKGGQLAKRAYPAKVVSLLFSDVIGDDLGSIASGPTAPDDTTFKDAMKYIREFNMKVPKSVLDYIMKGMKDKSLETPGDSDHVFKKVENFILVNNLAALNAMKEEARKMRLSATILSSVLEGEAREVGTALSGIAKEALSSSNPLKKPCAIIIGGETTVTIKGKGKGGRNQELVLSALRKIAGLDGVSIVSAGSDGRDGPTDADGAVCAGDSLGQALQKKLDPVLYLQSNDAYNFFKKAGGLLMTGPTGTNVGDLMAIVIL